MTSREPMEPINEEARDLVDLEDVSEFEHTNKSTEHIDKANEDNPDRRISPEGPGLPNFLLD